MSVNLFFKDGTHLNAQPDLVLAKTAAKIAGVSVSTFLRHVQLGSIVSSGELASGIRVYRRRDADQLAVALRRHRPEPPATEDDKHVAISIHQPFANEIREGKKRFEFRTWRLTKLPLRLVICASARKPPKGLEHLPTGCTVAVATVYACLPLEGGWAWCFKDVIALPHYPVKGRQGLFKLSDLTLKRRPRPAGAVGQARS